MIEKRFLHLVTLTDFLKSPKIIFKSYTEQTRFQYLGLCGDLQIKFCTRVNVNKDMCNSETERLAPPPELHYLALFAGATAPTHFLARELARNRSIVQLSLRLYADKRHATWCKLGIW